MIKDLVSSMELFDIAKNNLVGGVNSPVRSFKSVGLDPIYFVSGNGAVITSVEGRNFIDYVLGWGAFILGHADEQVVNFVKQYADRGFHFGACHPLEVEFSLLIKEAFKSIDKIRVVNSGTEAVMVAIRLARAFTGRKKIVKFLGNYHGHVDYFLVKAGSGLATFGLPSSKGIPEEVINQTLLVEYNDFEGIERVFDRFGKEIAAVIIEPVAGNIGVLVPQNGFLKKLREITSNYGSLLIFDEVITGFRFEFGGLSNYYDPELVVLGKIVGGGLPIGVVAGKKEVMDLLAPLGEVYQGGTFSANPLSLAAGVATLKKLKSLNYGYLEEMAQLFQEGIVSIKNRFNNVNLRINRYGSMMSLFFNSEDVINSQVAYKSNRDLFSMLYKFLLEKGIYLPPSPFEAFFLSFKHSINEINYTIDRVEEFFMNM